MLNLSRNKSTALPNRSFQFENRASTSNSQKSSKLSSGSRSEYSRAKRSSPNDVVSHANYRAAPRQSMRASSRNAPNASSLLKAPGNPQPAGTLSTRSGRSSQVGDGQAKNAKLKTPIWAWAAAAGLVAIISRQQVLDQMAEENAPPVSPNGEEPPAGEEPPGAAESGEGKENKPAVLKSSQSWGQKWAQKIGIGRNQKGKNQIS